MQYVFACLFFLFEVTCFSQDSLKTGFWDNSREFNKNRFYAVSGANVALFSSTFYFLHQTWYEDFDKAPLHSFDDGKQWLQVDKAGHFITAFQIARLEKEAYSWTGLTHQKSVVTGAAISLLFTTTIEVFDGFSREWGFSWFDMAANTGGISAFLIQEFLWQELKFKFKYSYHNTKYPDYRPGLLGSNLPERLVKDYNGQTYWVSFSPFTFSSDPVIPKWLCISVGYGATGMTGGEINPAFNENMESIPDFVRKRKIYFSLDIDLHKLNTRNKALNSVLRTFGFIKIPAPTMELEINGNLRFHPLYF